MANYQTDNDVTAVDTTRTAKRSWDTSSPAVEKTEVPVRRGPARSLPASDKYRKILGVQFFVGDATQAVANGMRGGLVVAPAAPSLLALCDDRDYRQALLESDLAITDSGFMVMLWNAFAPDKIQRVSGLKYLKLLLSQPEVQRAGATFWVVPTKEALQTNLNWLRSHGLHVEEKDCYVAPQYKPGQISDDALLKAIEDRRPDHVVICVGGGVQERLGLYIKQRCSFRPGIHCVGAAISFLTGEQAPIPDWADEWMLGWLFRCMYNPNRFVPRYAKAFRLALVMWRFRDRLPH